MRQRLRSQSFPVNMINIFLWCNWYILTIYNSNSLPFVVAPTASYARHRNQITPNSFSWAESRDYSKCLFAVKRYQQAAKTHANQLCTPLGAQNWLALSALLYRVVFTQHCLLLWLFITMNQPDWPPFCHGGQRTRKQKAGTVRNTRTQ